MEKKSKRVPWVALGGRTRSTNRGSTCNTRPGENGRMFKQNKVGKKMGDPRGDHLRLLKKMTRRKVIHFNFTQVTIREKLRTIGDITSKMSYSIMMY